jgi:hypothetical protein
MDWGRIEQALRWNYPGRIESPNEVTEIMESFPTMIEEGWEGSGEWEWDNVPAVEVVW